MQYFILSSYLTSQTQVPMCKNVCKLLNYLKKKSSEGVFTIVNKKLTSSIG